MNCTAECADYRGEHEPGLCTAAEHWVKWLVLVLTWAMVLDHLDPGRGIVNTALGILFGGIVLALSLAVGLGSRELVRRSLERETSKPVEMPQSEQLRHF